MKTEAFDYELPREFIAQHPVAERASSSLLVLNRTSGRVEHRHFRDITGYFRPGDVLVLNDSRVIPARLPARKTTGGRVDLLLVEELAGGGWSCLVEGVRKASVPVTLFVEDVPIVVNADSPFWRAEFPEGTNVFDLMARVGRMPLPHYIRRGENGDNEADFERYQTVYAESLGSIAAPTAGFHFTDDLIREVRALGVEIVKVTLHIGVGTFFLIKKEQIEEHRMLGEYYRISPDAISSIVAAKDEGRRVVAVGTSAVRTLETAFAGTEPAASGFTELFIYPGYEFRTVDAVITNFHLPRSTPLLLVSAFAGREQLFRCYSEAMERNYRFASYGDAMLII